MELGFKIFLILGWFSAGFIIQIVWAQEKYADGFELCNPYWAYEYHKNVNWFGAIVLSLIYSIFCPPTAIIYWIYKLGTIGRE